MFICYSVEIVQKIVLLIDTRGVQMPPKCGRSLQKCESSEVIELGVFFSFHKHFSMHIFISGMAVHAVI
jgi:hypothetical protein